MPTVAPMPHGRFSAVVQNRFDQLPFPVELIDASALRAGIEIAVVEHIQAVIHLIAQLLDREIVKVDHISPFLFVVREANGRVPLFSISLIAQEG